jgi:hypothetical protein
LLYLPGLGAALMLAGVLNGAHRHEFARLKPSRSDEGVSSPEPPAPSPGASSPEPRVPSSGIVLAVMACAACAAWSWSLSGRWALAGTISDGTLAALKQAVDREPGDRIYLAAVPDSVGGAYLLRNGVREALQTAGAVRPERVAVLAWYFLDPARPDVCPVRLAPAAVGALLLESLTSMPQVIAGTPDGAYLVEYEAAASLDRLGRRSAVIIRPREPGAAWLVKPSAVETRR